MVGRFLWFDTWSEVLRVILVGPASYFVLILVLRTSAKCTLAKLNAFDLVVTVALGSTLVTIFLNKDVSWAEGVAALAVLALLPPWALIRRMTAEGVHVDRAAGGTATPDDVECGGLRPSVPSGRELACQVG